MTSTKAMASYSLFTSFSISLEHLEQLRRSRRATAEFLEVELPLHYTVGTGAQVCVCSTICVRLFPAIVGKVRFGTYRRLSHLVHSLLWMSCWTSWVRFLDTNPISMQQLASVLSLSNSPIHIIVDTWRVVRSWGMPRPTSFCEVR